MAFSDVYQGPPPPVWFAGFARRRGARVVASSFDGILLPPMLTPAGTRRAVSRIHDECERIGRDPATIRICQPVVTAPDLRDSETRAIAHGRAVGYLQYPGYGDILAEENGWDIEVINKMRQHKQFQGLDKVADRTFHRQELLEPAELLPDEWMKDCCAIGSVDECVTSLRRYRDAGADEIATYGSTPEQNADLIEAWRAATPSTG
jgi:probable F420-dependent oxidoreductase